jgi:hypothetical protein
MRVRRGVGAWLWVLLAAAGEAGAAGWGAGAAKVDITPEKPVWLAGYAARKAPSEGVALPIAARALALRDEAGKTAMVLTVDLVGVKRPLTDRVKARIAEAHGLPPEAIALVASHTHGAPIPMDTPERTDAYGIDPASAAANVAWTKALEDRLVKAAGEAIAAIRPATLSHGTGEAPFAMNRREPLPNGGFKIGVNPLGPTDRRVPVLKVSASASEGDAAAPTAVVFGYACHCTTLGADMMRVHGDYAGIAAETIERAHPGTVALFLTGCGADANPYPRGRLAQAVTYGGQLADAVEAVLAGKDLRPLSGPLRVAAAEPTLRFAGPTDRASYEAIANDPRANAGKKAHAARMLSRLERGQPIETTHPYPVQAFALGDALTIVTLAGEVVVDYALRVEAEREGKGPAVWIAAYANDVFGYVPSRRVLQEGGYEGGEAFYYSSYPTPLADDVEETIMGAVREVLGRVAGK